MHQYSISAGTFNIGSSLTPKRREKGKGEVQGIGSGDKTETREKGEEKCRGSVRMTRQRRKWGLTDRFGSVLQAKRRTGFT